MSSAPFEEGYYPGFEDLEYADSGYVSADNSKAALPEVFFSKQHLKFINSQLQRLEPQDILRWCIITLPELFQETAFGLSGLATIDMLSKLSVGPISPSINLIFMDTLHHFDETLALVEKIETKYPSSIVHVFKPEGCDNADDFAAKYGDNLWEKNEELYDWKAKVEPSERAYAELNVKAVLTGRRKTQGGKRGNLDIVEVDDAGLIKVNPLANWTFDQVADYIRENDVPYNELLDQGYKSIGDWHSTQPVAPGEDERAGRWKGRAKTECGIHNPKSRYAMFLMEQQQKEQEEALSKEMGENLVISS
jgi:phosphoadenosine phosphosulfate reductase